MRKLILFILVLAQGVLSYAATDTITATINNYGTPTAISISTSVYVNATPSNVSINRQTAILIDNPSTNTGTMHGHIGNCTSTSISQTTVKGPIEIAPGTNGGVISISNGSCLWLISRHTSAESVTVQAVDQH